MEEDIGRQTRLKMRDSFVDGALIKTIVKDIKYLLLLDGEEFKEDEIDSLGLWDDKKDLVSYGVNYSKFD